MVRTVLAEADPAMTLAGENEQLMPSGRFEQEKETGLTNDPDCRVTATWMLPACPWGMVNADGDAVTFATPGPQFALYATRFDIWFFRPGFPIACTYNV